MPARGVAGAARPLVAETDIGRKIGGKQVAVTERIECRKTFGQLKHFVREGRENDPKLLIVAPMSGHFATLLRGTVERMLPRQDVYITDWRDARNVPLSEGHLDRKSTRLNSSH